MQRVYGRWLVAVIGLGLVAALGAVPAGASPQHAANERTYEVTVDNLTTGQPFTPPVAVAHQGSANVFDVGSVASPGVQAVAENGGVPALVAEVEGAHGVGSVVVGDAVGPVVPGGSTTFEITADRGNRWLSLVSMLICTNDGFTGLDTLKLPNRLGAMTVVELGSYDAGTEVNTEDWDDLVPPCAALTGFDAGGAGTGTSNPALAEGGVISPHPGIAGVADLVPAVHDWDDPVARVTITRVD